MFNNVIYDTLADAHKDGLIADKTLNDFSNWMGKTKNWHEPTLYTFYEQGDMYNEKTKKVKKTQTQIEVKYYCMRAFHHNYRSPTDALMFKIKHKDGRPTITTAFYKYLFGPSSPWKTAFPGMAAISPDKNGIPDYILWHDVSLAPAKTVANLFCTIRLHTCWGADWFWYRLRELGFSDEAALLLSTCFSWANQTITISNGPKEKYDEKPYEKLKLCKFGPSKTDMPFSTNANPSGFLSFLVDKKPKVTSGTLAQKTPTQPNNFIWEDAGEEYSADSLPSDDTRHKKSLIKVDRNTDPFNLKETLKKGSLSEATFKTINDALYKKKEILL